MISNFWGRIRITVVEHPYYIHSAVLGTMLTGIAGKRVFRVSGGRGKNSFQHHRKCTSPVLGVLDRNCCMPSWLKLELSCLYLFGDACLAWSITFFPSRITFLTPCFFIGFFKARKAEGRRPFAVEILLFPGLALGPTYSITSRFHPHLRQPL